MLYTFPTTFSRCLPLGFLILSNFAEKASFLPRVMGMDVRNYNGLRIVRTPYPSDTFNAVVSLGELGHVKDMQHIIDDFSRDDLPMAWWSHDSSDDIDKLKKLQLVHDEDNIGMLLYPDRARNTSNYELAALDLVKMAVHRDIIHDFGKVISSIFTEPGDPYVSQFYSDVSEFKITKDMPLKMFVGYKDGKPVSTVSLFSIQDRNNRCICGIYDMATIETERRKGYGGDILRYCLNQASKINCDTIVLQASEDGIGIYKKAGFKEVCKLVTFSNLDSLKQRFDPENTIRKRF